MDDVNHWNVLIFLLPRIDVDKINKLLQLLEETTDVFNLSYVFASQC
jgi:hypothetical protein